MKKEKIRMNTMQMERGITLISLVITIIILLILAGVTISITLGDNGLFKTAKKSSEEYNKQAAIELIRLKIANSQINSYDKFKRMPTLQEVADDFWEDDEIEYVALSSKKQEDITNKDKINLQNRTSFFTKLKAYPYEFEIGESLEILKIDGQKEDNLNDDNTNLAENVGEYTSKVISNFSPIVTFNNGAYLEVTNNATTTDGSTILEYFYIVDGKVNKKTSEKEATIDNLEMGKTYNLQVLAIDENGKVKYSNTIKVTTETKVYLYKEGKEFEGITGGWIAAVNCGDGNLNKDPNNNYMTYTCSGGGRRFGSIASSEKINIQGYSKLYIEYNTTAPANKNLGFATQQTYNGSDFGWVGSNISLNNDGENHTDFIEISADTIDTSIEYYVQIYFNGDEGAVNCKVFNIWLEK